MAEGRGLGPIRRLAGPLIGVVVGWLVLPFLLPFLLALGIAALLEPAVTGLMRAGVPRWGAAALCTAALTALAAGGTALAVWRLMVEAAGLAQRLPALLGQLEHWGGGLEGWIYRLLVAAPPTLREGLEGTLDALAQQAQALPAQLSARLGEGLARGLAALPGAVLFVFTTVLATYFTSAGRPRLLAFLARQLPRRWQGRLTEVGGRLRDTLGGWLRAQGLLMLVTFGLLLVGLLVLGVPSPLLLSALTALVDALPLFGAGVVLLPWAVGCLVLGRLGQAVGLLLLAALAALVRSLLEPKLLGDRMGLPPLATLCAMYVGARAFGVAGMILAPLLLTFLGQLHRAGLVRLWREAGEGPSDEI